MSFAFCGTQRPKEFVVTYHNNVIELFHRKKESSMPDAEKIVCLFVCLLACFSFLFTI
jgi:hypothetical protein